ncbi:MAG TPA: isochorismatase family cysteine hydrolase [Candidatus Kapabacteria bacterium]|nr:isochorismatase family cysteine hydrolase [Candidatus Kapabacteria bacterium]
MTFLETEELPTKVDQWSKALNIDNIRQIEFRSPVLIILDMQKDFLLKEGLLKVWGGPAIIPNLQKLIKVFHKNDLPVIFTRHIYENPEQDGGATARWWKANRHSMLLREHTWHSEISDFLIPDTKDRIISKRRYSAFFGTDLEILLRTANINDVVITGVCTNICCEATAHDAFFRDFNIFFVIDGTGATDEEAHLSSLRNISLAYGNIVTTAQIINSVDNIFNAKV